MASALLSRAFTGLRSVRSQAFHAPASPVSSALFKRRAAYSRSILPSFVSRGSGFLRCIATASSSAGMTTSAEQAVVHSESVVSADWLHANLRAPDVKVLDASWYMPDEQRNPLQEYQLPHMLPSEKAFGAAVSALGIHNKDGVIVYDGKGIFSAARVWWMFRVFGHDKVWVLDGGLPQWHSSGYDVESSASGDAILKASAASEAIKKVYQGQLVKENIEAQTHQQIDARSKRSHILKVYRVNNVVKIPSQYILKRWTRYAKSGVAVNESGAQIQADFEIPYFLRHNSLCHQGMAIAAKGASSMEVYKVAQHWLEKALMEVENALKRETFGFMVSNNNEAAKIKEGKKKRKGNPSNARLEKGSEGVRDQTIEVPNDNEMIVEARPINNNFDDKERLYGIFGTKLSIYRLDCQQGWLMSILQTNIC